MNHEPSRRRVGLFCPRCGKHSNLEQLDKHLKRVHDVKPRRAVEIKYEKYAEWKEEHLD